MGFKSLNLFNCQEQNKSDRTQTDGEGKRNPLSTCTMTYLKKEVPKYYNNSIFTFTLNLCDPSEEIAAYVDGIIFSAAYAIVLDSLIKHEQDFRCCKCILFTIGQLIVLTSKQ